MHAKCAQCGLCVWHCDRSRVPHLPHAHARSKDATNLTADVLTNSLIAIKGATVRAACVIATEAEPPDMCVCVFVCVLPTGW